MPKIFISYRREDAPDSAGRLYDSLKAHFGEGAVFLDVEDLGPGLPFLQAITYELSQCTVLLAVIGPHWLNTAKATAGSDVDGPGEYVEHEIGQALSMTVLVVPVLVRDAEMPRSDKLPRSIRRLADLNAVSLRHAMWKMDVATLCQKIEPIVQLERRVIAWADRHGISDPYNMGRKNYEHCLFELGHPRGTEHGLEYDEFGHLIYQ